MSLSVCLFVCGGDRGIEGGGVVSDRWTGGLRDRAGEGRSHEPRDDVETLCVHRRRVMELRLDSRLLVSFLSLLVLRVSVRVRA